MQAFASNNLTVEKEELSSDSLPDFTSESYKDAYSRINAVVIEGEQEAYSNFLDLAKLIPCLLYTSPSPRDLSTSRMPSSA